jgi:cell division cycle 20, cofactor of APC complex
MKQEIQNIENTETTKTSPKQTDRQKVLCDTLQGCDLKTHRILSYQTKAPAAPESHMNPLRVVYSAKTPISTKSGTRYIPSSPERILDAPDIINDYCALH